MKKHDKHYCRSDGNGGLNISKSIVYSVIIPSAGLLITILVLLATSAMSYGKLEQKVDSIQKMMPQHDASTEKVKDDILVNSKRIIALETDIKNININTIETKKTIEDVRDLIIKFHVKE